MVKSFRVIATSFAFLLIGGTVSSSSLQEGQEKPKEQEKQQAKPAENQQKPARGDQQQAKPQQDQRQQRNQQDHSAKQEQQQTKKQQDSQRQQQDNAAKQQQQQAKRQQDQQRKQQDNSAKQQQQAQRQQNQERQQRQPQEVRSGPNRSSAQVSQQQVAWRGDRASSWQSEHRTWQQRGGYSGYRVPDDRFRSFYGQAHIFRIYTLPVIYVGGQRRFQYGGYWFGLVDPWPEYWANDWYDNDDVYVDYYDDGYYLYNRRYPGDRIAITFYLN